MADKVIAENRKARHDYEILETYEAGLQLKGTEVKALREGRVSLRESYAKIEDGEAFLHNAHISEYSNKGYEDHDPKRPRKLLLHKRELYRLGGKTAEKGLTIVPLRLYFKRGLAKVELALAKGKHLYDKRQAIKERLMEREVDRLLKDRSLERGRKKTE